MKGFHEVDPAQINDNFIHDIGSDWMLITAGDHVRHNAMTASWGGVGVIWGFPVAVAVIRPQRYTFGLVEQNDTLTLSFLPEQYREALKYCGSHSGRDEDKLHNAGLAVEFTDNDTPRHRRGASRTGVPQALRRHDPSPRTSSTAASSNDGIRRPTFTRHTCCA